MTQVPSRAPTEQDLCSSQVTRTLRLLSERGPESAHSRALLQFICSQPVLSHRTYVDLPGGIPAQRQLVLEQVTCLARSGLVDFRDQLTRPLRWAATWSAVSLLGPSISTKFGVHFGLFGGTLLHCGREHHVQRYAEAVQDLRVRGCFCLTELGQGSNARALETTATFDPASDCFVLQTPHDRAQKYWAGNLALHCSHAVVFAQLYVQSTLQGVHAFIVQIRDDQGNLCPGIRVQDCGAKAGLNTIDNGRLWLEQVRVPREDLLDRLGGVDAQGRYHSALKTPAARFTALLAQLVGGRVGMCISATNLSKVGLKVALLYSGTRPQFGPAPPDNSVSSELRLQRPIMHLRTHQLLLFPAVARCYAMDAALYRLQQRVHGRDLEHDPLSESQRKELHVEAAALKAFATWHRARALQLARECCGGQGVLAANLIGVFKNDSDVDVTWEGQNHVLLQQVAGARLKQLLGQGQIASMKLFVGQWWRRQRFWSGAGTSTEGFRPLCEEALRFRTVQLTLDVGLGLKRSKEEELFEKWNSVLGKVCDLGMAVAEEYAVESFSQALVELNQEHGLQSKMPQGWTVMQQLAELHAIWTLLQYADWFLVDGYLARNTVLALQERMEQLCVGLEPVSADLAHGFGVPDALSDAPIARDWVVLNAYGHVPQPLCGTVAARL